MIELGNKLSWKLPTFYPERCNSPITQLRKVKGKGFQALPSMCKKSKYKIEIRQAALPIACVCSLCDVSETSYLHHLTHLYFPFALHSDALRRIIYC